MLPYKINPPTAIITKTTINMGSALITGIYVILNKSKMQVFNLLKRYTPKDLIVITLLTVVYFLSGKLGLMLAFFNPSATPVWPPTGIAIAALLISGYKVWPAVLAGAFLVNATTAGGIPTSVGIAIGNTLEGLVAVYLIKRFTATTNPFLRTSDIFKYVVLAGIFSTALSATIGIATLFLGGLVTRADLSETWITWWLGDMGGALFIAPLIILWRFDYKIYYNERQVKEIIALILFLILSAVLVFGRILPPTVVEYSLAFICLPILVWVAFRFGPREAITGIVLIAMAAVFATLTGFGPFVRAGPNQALVLLQLFMGIIFLAVMPLSTAILQERRAEIRYKALVDTSPDPVVLIGLDGIIQFANKQTLVMYGLEHESEIVGQSGFKYVAPEDKKKTQAILKDIVLKKSLNNVEYVSVRKDGSRFNTSSNATVLFDQRGNPIGIVGVIHDITREKQLDKAKSDFFALVAHQLRTPLTTMRWNLEYLVKGKYGKLSEAQEEKIKTVQISNISLIELVDTLLDISKIEQGVLPNRPEITDFKQIFDQVITEVQNPADRKKIKINVNINKEVGKIKIDPQRFKEILLNMILNSIYYNNDNGKIDIVVDKKDSSLYIGISDDGVGIPPNDREKIFGKYYRGAKAKDIYKEGVGMGLFMVKSFIDMNHGKISFKSPGKFGKGTTFYIELPISK